MTNDTPILQLFRAYEALGAAARNSQFTDDADDVRLFYDPQNEIEAAMMAIPCTCAADFAAKAIVATANGETFPVWETSALWVEARSLIN